MLKGARPCQSSFMRPHFPYLLNTFHWIEFVLKWHAYCKSSHDQSQSGYRFDLYCISMATACHCKRGGALSSLCQYCSAGVAKFHFSGGFYKQALLNTSTSTLQSDILKKEKKPNKLYNHYTTSPAKRKYKYFSPTQLNKSTSDQLCWTILSCKRLRSSCPLLCATDDLHNANCTMICTCTDICTIPHENCVTRAPILYFIRSWVALSF